MFSAFPTGGPGFGLLVMRGVLGVTSVAHAAVGLGGVDESAILAWIVGPLAIVSGAALVAGLMTPFAAVITALGELAGWCCYPTGPSFLASNPTTLFFAVTNGIAIVLTGPGAYSVDARLFGRREIVFSRDDGLPRT